MMSPQFAKLLAAGRPEFNRRVAEARRRFPAFDTEAFGSFLQSAADSVVRTAAGHAPERAAAVAVAAYDAALELVAHGQAGIIAGRVWRELAPRYAALLAAHPVQVLGLLTNAALHLEKCAYARPAEWLSLMSGIAPHVVQLEHLAGTGQICAWRSGMAHFRKGALAAADALPEPLALALFGATAKPAPAWAALRDSLQRDPWWTPDAAARERVLSGVDIGAFTGFGGAFGQPPEVRPAAEGFWVRSGERYMLLVADAYGAVLHPASEDEYAHPGVPLAQAVISQSGQRLAINGRTVDLDLPADRLRIVCNEHTAAITSPYSHAIRVLPLR